MSTSGTYAVNPSLGEIVLYALGLCEIRGPEITQAHMESARMAANLMLGRWSAASGVNLWKVDLVTVPLVQGTATYSVDPSTITVLDADHQHRPLRVVQAVEKFVGAGVQRLGIGHRRLGPRHLGARAARHVARYLEVEAFEVVLAGAADLNAVQRQSGSPSRGGGAVKRPLYARGGGVWEVGTAPTRTSRCW